MLGHSIISGHVDPDILCLRHLCLQFQEGKDRLLCLLENAKPYLSPKAYKERMKDLDTLLSQRQDDRCEGGEEPGAMYILHGKDEHG